ncbi:hypothetical protein ACFQ10_47865 [Streptomyces indonesiensis]
MRIEAAAVSHLDLNVIDGTFGILPDLPAVPGTAGSGIVVASDTHPEGASSASAARHSGCAATAPGAATHWSRTPRWRRCPTARTPPWPVVSSPPRARRGPRCTRWRTSSPGSGSW